MLVPSATERRQRCTTHTDATGTAGPSRGLTGLAAVASATAVGVVTGMAARETQDDQPAQAQQTPSKAAPQARAVVRRQQRPRRTVVEVRTITRASSPGVVTTGGGSVQLGGPPAVGSSEWFLRVRGRRREQRRLSTRACAGPGTRPGSQLRLMSSQTWELWGTYAFLAVDGATRLHRTARATADALLDEVEAGLQPLPRGTPG